MEQAVRGNAHWTVLLTSSPIAGCGSGGGWVD